MSDAPAYQDEIERLKARLAHLEQTHLWYINAMNMLILMSEVYGSSEDVRNEQSIFRAARNYVAQLADFAAIIFFKVDERDSSFVLTECSQNYQQQFDLEGLKQSLIDKGEFAWAISQNRTIEVESDTLQQRIIMHVLTTKTRVRGCLSAFRHPINLDLASRAKI